MTTNGDSTSEPTTKADLYLEYLREEGYRPELDADGDVKFKHEGRTYYLLVEEEDRPYFRLIAPYFWSIESEEERERALRVMANVNADLKVVKIYPTREDTTASVELFLVPIESFRAVFPRCMSLLANAVSRFIQGMREPVN